MSLILVPLLTLGELEALLARIRELRPGRHFTGTTGNLYRLANPALSRDRRRVCFYRSGSRAGRIESDLLGFFLYELGEWRD